MTYADWEAEDRLPGSREDFLAIEAKFLNGNPWLRDCFDFAALAGRDVLEIGCGSGAASCLLAKSGARVTAVDITETAVEMARRNAEAQGVALQARQEDAERLSFGDESFDFVFSWGVLHHSSNPDAAYREVARVLRPGGRGLLMVYNRDSLRYHLRGWQWLLLKGKLFSGDSLSSVQRHFTDGYFHRHYSPSGFVTALSAAGLETQATAVTHMGKPLLRLLPRRLDDMLKARAGWLLVAEVRRPAAAE
ncbi:MAG: class I SAM-dependent methyltransferase [Rhodovibrionaceae bacterium]